MSAQQKEDGVSGKQSRPLRLVTSETFSPETFSPDALSPDNAAPVARTTPSRSVQRRAAARRRIPGQNPVQRDPVALLQHLDEEPVEAPGSRPPTTPDEDAPEKPADAEPRTKAAPKPAARKRAVSRPKTPAESTRSRWRLRRPTLRRPSWPAALLLVLLVAALAAAGVFGQRWYAARTLDAAHQQALAAAKQTTVNFVSVSASSVDRDLQRITAGATGEFKDEFVRGQAQVRAAVVENKVESSGSVLRAALVSGDRRTATVLVAVDATVKNVKAPEGRPSHYRIQVDVTRDPDTGRWLVNRLQFVG